MTGTDMRDDRAEQAARDHLTGQLAGTDFAPIPPDSLIGRRTGGPSGRRLALGLAAAACLLAGVVALPLVLGGTPAPSGPIPASPAPEPPTTSAPASPGTASSPWTAIAAPALSPRSGSITAWLGGQFYLLGGWDGGPCPPGSTCDMKEPELVDGARYDPATGTWEAIADAPAGLGRDFASSAVVDGTLYLSLDNGFWAYHPEEDRWQRLSAPPSGGRLVGADGLLLAARWDGILGFLYQPADDSWVAVDPGPLDGCDQQQVLGAGERFAAIGSCGEDATSGLRLSLYDPGAQSWSEPVDLDGHVRGVAVYAAGRLVWPGPLSVVSSFRGSGMLDLASGEWIPVESAGGPAGLSYRLVDSPSEPLALGSLVEANGQFLDAATATWVPVPESPVANRWDPVRVAGEDAVLDCFGFRYIGDDYDPDSPNLGFHDGCFLLRVP